jgi:chromosome segregation ATPase
MNSARFNRLLVADKGELLVGLRERISEGKVALKKKKEYQTNLHDNLKILGSKLRRSDDELRAIGSKIRQSLNKREYLKAEIAENQAAGVVSTSLEEEKDELQDALDKLIQSEVEKKILYDEISAKLKELKLDATEAEKKRTALERGLKKEGSKLEKLLEDDDSKKRYTFFVV